MTPAMTDPGDRFFLRGDVRGVQLRLYWPGDELKVQARADFAELFMAAGERLHEGPKWSLVTPRLVLAVGGFEHLDDDVWGAWAYAGALTPREWVFGARCAMACMDWLRRTEGARVQVVVHTAAARRLAMRMGFSMSCGWRRLYEEAA